MKTAVLHDSSRVIPYRKNWSSELAVVVIPLRAWGILLNGIPKFHIRVTANTVRIVFHRHYNRYEAVGFRVISSGKRE
jgi:hypothetical protein